MPKSTDWVWAAVIGAGSVWAAPPSSKGHDEPLPATVSAPKEVPPNEAWFPRLKEHNRGTEPKIEDAPPSAFPGLVFVTPRWDREETPEEFVEKSTAAFEKTWPLLTEKMALKIDLADNARQKLLKARLHLGALEYREHLIITTRIHIGPAPAFTPIFDCLKEIQAVVLELWSGQPKELIPWLEELVTAAKNQERYVRLRAEVGARSPYQLSYATRHRLKAEAELWKAKNANVQHDESPSVKKDDAKAKPAESEWLNDKKLPPSLFPDIVLTRDKNAPDEKWRLAQYAKLCPRLNGNTGLKVEDGDSTLQKLLKARLHQGALEIQQIWADIVDKDFRERDASLRYDCLGDMIAVAVELWGKQPKQLIPWLEEFLIEAKEFERYAQLRLEAGAILPRELNQATRHRLKVEGELWKAKNAK